MPVRRPEVLDEDIARLPHLVVPNSNFLRGHHRHGVGNEGINMPTPSLLQGSKGRRLGYLRAMVPIHPGCR